MVGLDNYTTSKKSGRFYHIYAKRKIEDETLLSKTITNDLLVKQKKYQSDMLKKAKNEKINIIITNTLKELEKIKTIQINDNKSNILNNSSIETDILSYIESSAKKYAIVLG